MITEYYRFPLPASCSASEGARMSTEIDEGGRLRRCGCTLRMGGARLCTDRATLDPVGSTTGGKRTPAEFGVITAPSAEQRAQMPQPRRGRGGQRRTPLGCGGSSGLPESRPWRSG